MKQPGAIANLLHPSGTRPDDISDRVQNPWSGGAGLQRSGIFAKKKLQKNKNLAKFPTEISAPLHLFS